MCIAVPPLPSPLGVRVSDHISDKVPSLPSLPPRSPKPRRISMDLHTTGSRKRFPYKRLYSVEKIESQESSQKEKEGADGKQLLEEELVLHQNMLNELQPEMEASKTSQPSSVAQLIVPSEFTVKVTVYISIS